MLRLRRLSNMVYVALALTLDVTLNVALTVVEARCCALRTETISGVGLIENPLCPPPTSPGPAADLNTAEFTFNVWCV